MAEGIGCQTVLLGALDVMQLSVVIQFKVSSAEDLCEISLRIPIISQCRVCFGEDGAG